MNNSLSFCMAACLLLLASACTSSDSTMEESPIKHGRNSSFDGEVLSVFISLEGVVDASVSTEHDAIETSPGETLLPGHTARNWTMLQAREDGTSIVYGLVSWDPENPADYLMAGWWAELPGQQPPDLDLAEARRFAVVDGPELDPASPPDLPVSGQATYLGQSGGWYAYQAAGEDTAVLDEYGGTVNLTVDFRAGTVSGCVGCIGDLVTRRVHLGFHLGDEVVDTESLARDYEIHLGAVPLTPEGSFEGPSVSVTHPERTVVRTQGYWGGGVSNVPDSAGNPRLAAGFSTAEFLEEDGGQGGFVGVFVGLSEPYRSSPGR